MTTPSEGAGVTRGSWFSREASEPFDECEHCGTPLCNEERLKSACPDCIADGLPHTDDSIAQCQAAKGQVRCVYRQNHSEEFPHRFEEER